MIAKTKAETFEDFVEELAETLAEIARLEQEIAELRAFDETIDERDSKPLLH